jgi:sugar phosphate isomerase/epimerase
MYTRRDFGKMALVSLPLANAFGAIQSKFGGVQIGAITYSFRTLKAEEIIPAMAKAGLGEAEVMSNHAEALAGAPPAPAGRNPNPEAAANLQKWRMSTTPDTFKPVRKQFEQAGIDVQLLCYNLNGNVSDDEIEYSFQMAKSLGVRIISSSSQITVAKRVAAFADKHKIRWGGHGHDRTDDPNEFATPESFATILSYGKYMGVNLDIGHFTAANYDAAAFLKENHARITNLHLKDRKKNHGANVPWGTGDTPIKEVLQLLKKEKYPIPANVEYEYPGKDDVVTEVGRCVEFCKAALA